MVPPHSLCACVVRNAIFWTLAASVQAESQKKEEVIAIYCTQDGRYVYKMNTISYFPYIGSQRSVG